MDSPMGANSKLLPDQWKLLHNPGRYRRFVGKLNCLSVNQSNVTYPISVMSQFLSAPQTSHWDVVIRILWYLKRAPGRGLLHSNCSH